MSATRGSPGAGEQSHGVAGILQASVAAVLFGLASPAAKLLLSGTLPVVLAGILYVAAGIGLTVWWLLRRAFGKAGARREAGLTAGDMPSLCGAVIFGGIVGPVLQMVGLRTSPASTASLLLCTEGVFTALLAWFIFREHFDRRIAAGMALVVAGGALLAWTGRLDAIPLGSVAILGACFAWGVDNNVTRRIANRDPVQIAAVKGLVAGSCNLAIGLAVGGALPAPRYVLGAVALGLFGYGASLVFFVLALRHIGSGRTTAYFALAPFVGSAVSLLALHERPSASMAVAALLMAGGIYLHVTELHRHAHRHDGVHHDHRHVHDEHHQHGHGPSDPVGEPHAHQHCHAGLVHEHRHFPDNHHRHQH